MSSTAKTSGRSNYMGVNYQAWAAMVLFLVRLNDGGFDLIKLEDEKWDFTLVYRTGKKIVCESKYRSSNLGVADVKKIFDSILLRKEKIKDGDEIIIITPSVVDDLSDNLSYIQFYEPLKDKYRQLGFTEEHLALLSKTSFYLAESAEYLYKEAITYFYSLVPYWLPGNEVDRWLKSVLLDQVYVKSATGQSFTRTELSEIVEAYRKEKINFEVDYDTEQRKIERQVDTILSSVENNDPSTIKGRLASISAQPDRLFILLDKITDLQSIKLSDWDFLWKALLDRRVAFRILFNFEKHYIQDKESASYILDLFTSQIRSITNKTVDSINTDTALELVAKIVSLHSELTQKTLSFCEAFLYERARTYFDLERGTANSGEKQAIGGILYKLFEEYKSQNDEAGINRVLELADKHFSLVEDDGDPKFFIYTPRPVFDLLYEFVILDFTNNIKKVEQLLANQYRDGKFSGGEFKGWELMGGSTAHWGNDYRVDDRHFINYVLKPAIDREYKAKPELTWQYLLENWITTDKALVSATRPDFLNRASINILVSEYRKTKHSKEAFDILQKFVLMNKGIPAKSEVVFQAIRDNQGLSSSKKWKLVKAYLAKYKLPYSVFIEQITVELALAGHKEALKAISNWVDDKGYREQQNRNSFLLGDNMLKLLNASPDTDMYRTGTAILKAYISSPDYQQNLSTFDAYDITGSIARVISTNLTDGIALLWDIYNSSPALTTNQQVAICAPLIKLDKENPDLLLSVYDGFVRPLIMTELESDIAKLAAKFSHNYAREIFVQFAENLAEAKQFQPSLDLVKVFINDPNPQLINEPEDKDGTFNYHQRIINGEDSITINTVRGWCAWTLGRFAILQGRDYIPEAFSLLKGLTNDPNYYVRVMAILALVDFVRNRHTVLPDNSKERFISLEMAGEIEETTFAILRDKNNQKYPVILRHLSDVFSHMRSMTEAQALEVLNIYRDVNFGSDMNDIYPLFIFFALFRKAAFKNEINRVVYGDKLYEELVKFDDSKFKELLDDLIKVSPEDARARIAWHFWKLPKEEGVDYDEMFSISLRYLSKLVKPYSQHVLGDIYYFINDNIERKPDDCIALWRSCINTEKDYLLDNQNNLQPGQWWPHHYNGTVLTKIKDTLGDSEFLDSFEVLLSYPEQFDIGIDISVGYQQLKKLADAGDERASALKKKLADKFPRLHELERSSQSN